MKKGDKKVEKRNFKTEGGKENIRKTRKSIRRR
jgi:hypothetical protein